MEEVQDSENIEGRFTSTRQGLIRSRVNPENLRVHNAVEMIVQNYI
jgi:hypothetical protein